MRVRYLLDFLHARFSKQPPFRFPEVARLERLLSPKAVIQMREISGY
jgi:hypothetical protein